MKVAFITPHLSTGGMPQYLNNKIEKLKDSAEIWVFEKSHETTYNTVRARIENQIGEERIITWGSNPVRSLYNKILEIKPDIVHFEEPCEQFVSDFLLEKIFHRERTYKIFETLHDSSIEPAEKRFLPDKFLVVSPWQVYLLQSLGTPIEVIEHEITKKHQADKELSQRLLSFDSSKKHVLQVGIFTPRKNQRETIEIARSFPDIQFHFVGTLAENYKFYWEPILRSLPANCKIWGERDDVEYFYQAADLVILPSLPLFNDKETSPLVIKEALHWKTPLLLRNLDVYVDMFQESSNLKFMGKSREETLKKISNMMNTEPEEKKIDIFDLRFESEENKIFITYKDEKSLGLVFFSVKDRDSNTCIFGFDSWIDHFGAEIWCIPIPKPYFDFAENRNFSGFKIEAYQNKSDLVPFFTGEIELKKSIYKKRIASFPSLNYEPIFVNYSQFFVDWIYNGFFAGSRVKRAIDIGANIGLFTEWVLDRFGSDTEVISVEPNSQAVEAFEFLHKDKPNVHLKKLAVSEKSGDELELGVNPENSLISSLDHLEGLSLTEKVLTISLNDLLADFGWEECDLLKIDVEGAEYDIFKSVTSDDLKKFKFILMEFHYNNGRLRGLLNKMKEAGFSIDIRDDDTRFITTAENDRGTVFATRLD